MRKEEDPQGTIPHLGGGSGGYPIQRLPHGSEEDIFHFSGEPMAFPGSRVKKEVPGLIFREETLFSRKVFSGREIGQREMKNDRQF